MRQARYFLAVADVGTTGRAAEQLHMTQPALSQAIVSLERELGVQLFTRSARGMQLTPAGEALVAPARRLTEAASYAAAAMRQVKDVEAGRLEIGIMPALAAYPASVWVGQFTQLYPQVDVHMNFFFQEPIENFFASSSSELVVAHYTPEIPRTISRVPIGTQNLVAAFPPNHPAPEDAMVSLADLASLPLIVSPENSSMRVLVEEAFAAEGLQPRIGVETDFMDSFASLILAGAGYALLPMINVETLHLLGVRTRRLATPITRDISLLHRRGQLSHAARAFANIALNSPGL